MTHSQEKKQSIETDPKMTQVLKWADEDLKAVIKSALKDLKEMIMK